MIRYMNGVIIWTDDLASLRTFYVDTLGLTPRSDHPHFVNFEWGDVRFSIGSHDGVRGQARDPHRIMVNFDVGDIHGLHERLAGKGVSFIRPPEKEHWGGWVATFEDPDGNLLQLLQQPGG